MPESTAVRSLLQNPSNVQQTLPPLSPPFQHADDAARFAHELIGDRKAVAYSGCILQAKNGHFFSTRPVKNEGFFFEPWAFLSTNAHGQLINPDGYSCCAFYHSRGADYEALPDDLLGHFEEVATRSDFFLSTDMYSMLSLSDFSPVSYLSGLNGALIKYQCSGSEREKQLYEKLAGAVEKRVPLFSSAQVAIRELASAGALSVIQSTEVWHSKTGAVDATFTRYVASQALDIERVIINRPAFSPVLTSEVQTLDYMLSRIKQTSDSNYGFILRNAVSDQFLITQPLTGFMDFSLLRTLSPQDATDLVLPDGFEIIAVYGCEAEHHAADQLPRVQTLLFKNFIHPQSLKKAIDIGLTLGFRTDHRSLPIYIATRDGALLKYVSLLSAEEKKLFALLPPDEGGEMDLARNVLADVEPTLSYIQLVANAGELSVLRTSAQWSTVGRVQSHWLPYKHARPLSLSPDFLNADQAARYAHEHIARRVDAVYGGLVYQRPDGRFFATLPVAMFSERFDPENLLVPPLISGIAADCALVAFYQSPRIYPLQLWRPEVEEQLSRNMIPPHVLFEALKMPRGVRAHYFSAQDGALLKYTVSQSEIEDQLKIHLSPPAQQRQKVKANTLQMRLRANTLSPKIYVLDVARAGRLEVVVASSLWGPRGRVTQTWEPLPPLQWHGPKVGAIYSQIFTRETDAMRYAHENMGERQTRQSGYVLQSLRGTEFVVEEPVNAKGYTRFGDSLLSNEVPLEAFPTGFYPSAFYLAAPKHPATHVSDGVYANFFSPKDLSAMLSKLHGVSPGESTEPVYPLLYLSTRDGALLSYRTSAWSQEMESQVFRESGQVLLDSLKANQMSARDYVRHVASIGDLEVIVTSAQWSIAGPVLKTWEPAALPDVAPTAPTKDEL
ncbi:DUF4329 domain-containing protein [Pseudomonas sp. SIMBA_077]